MEAHHQLVRELEKGYRMEKPAYASNYIGEIMAGFWKADPKESPSFSHIEQTISSEMESTVSDHYLNLNDSYEKPTTFWLMAMRLPDSECWWWSLDSTPDCCRGSFWAWAFCPDVTSWLLPIPASTGISLHKTFQFIMEIWNEITERSTAVKKSGYFLSGIKGWLFRLFSFSYSSLAIKKLAASTAWGISNGAYFNFSHLVNIDELIFAALLLRINQSKLSATCVRVPAVPEGNFFFFFEF